MAAPDYTCTIGDTYLPLEIAFATDAGPIPLTAVILVLEGGSGSEYEIDLTASILSAPGGTVSHTWSTWPAAGDYRAQYRITSGADVVYVPTSTPPWYRYSFRDPL